MHVHGRAQPGHMPVTGMYSGESKTFMIKKILEHLGLWEECHALPVGDSPELEITFDHSYSQII